MSHYRLYFMNERSGHIDRAENLEADDDVQAVEAARKLAGKQPLELWRDTRKVYRFETPVTSFVARYRLKRPHADQSSMLNAERNGSVNTGR